jgi:hypothetical protein
VLLAVNLRGLLVPAAAPFAPGVDTAAKHSVENHAQCLSRPSTAWKLSKKKKKKPPKGWPPAHVCTASKHVPK